MKRMMTMTQKIDNPPAFPFTPTDRTGQCGDCIPGMSLRDWFAGQAIQGLIIAGGTQQIDYGVLIIRGYQIADEALEYRIKGNSP